MLETSPSIKGFLQSGPVSDVTSETSGARITHIPLQHLDDVLEEPFRNPFVCDFTSDLVGPQISIEVKSRKEVHVNCRFDGLLHVGNCHQENFPDDDEDTFRCVRNSIFVYDDPKC